MSEGDVAFQHMKIFKSRHTGRSHNFLHSVSRRKILRWPRESLQVIAWSGVGGFLMWRGVTNQRRWVRAIGAGLLGVAIFRLLTTQLANVPPAYLVGAIPLGVLMQASFAFQKVEGAFAFCNSYAKIAEWKALMDRVAQDVVFAIDSSDSMLWRDPLDYRKIAVKDYVAWMVPNDRGAVVDFDSAARVVNGDHLSSDYARIQADVDTIDSSGGVFLSAGLLLSLYELRDYGDATHKWLVIFETGAETENPRDPFYIPRAIDLAKDLGVAIYTVGLNVVEPEQRALMLQIADETGGRFFNSASASNLRKIYDDIAGLNATQGAFFTVSDSLSVTVDNTPPSLAVESSVPVNMTFRVAGEKYHDVAFSLLKDGAEIANATIIRMPGDPDNQSATIGTIDFDVASTYEARIVYTPDDDPVNGQESGANPAELILVFSDGTNVTLGHTFNVNHPDTWVWDVPDLEAFFVGRAVSLPVSISDPGTDDVTIAWDWGDGTIDLRTVFNDGVGPDPYPSPWGLPVSLTDVGVHTYATAGSYSVSLTVTDDDAGSTVLLFTLSVG